MKPLRLWWSCFCISHCMLQITKFAHRNPCSCFGASYTTSVDWLQSVAANLLPPPSPDPYDVIRGQNFFLLASFWYHLCRHLFISSIDLLSMSDMMASFFLRNIILIPPALLDYFRFNILNSYLLILYFKQRLLFLFSFCSSLYLCLFCARVGTPWTSCLWILLYFTPSSVWLDSGSVYYCPGLTPIGHDPPPFWQLHSLWAGFSLFLFSHNTFLSWKESTSAMLGVPL